MPSIGSFSVTGFRGRMMPASQKVAVLEAAPGTDGNGVVRGGWAAAPSTIVTSVDVLGAANIAEALRNQYRLQSGEVLTVVDQFAKSWPNTTVLAVEATYDALASSSAYRVTATWVLLPATVRP